MKSYKFNVRVMGNMELEVRANSREEAKRILDETIKNITDKNIKNEFNNLENAELKESNFHLKIKSERSQER